MKSPLKIFSFAMLIAAGMAACDKTNSNGEYKHPSDAVKQADGTYRYADGSVHNADGTVKTPAATSTPAPRNDTTKPTKPDAMSQGNDAAEREVTQAIRKAVVAREGMSMAAKNVVIVTEKGTVTLKGEVPTESEKATIAEIASSNAGSRTVDNQIVVKPSN